MKSVLIASLLSIATLSGVLGRFVRDSNSQVASTDALEAWSAGNYATARVGFDEAAKMNGTPVSRFNLGTAQIASGEIPLGTETLGTVVDDRELGSVSHYNRGNAALEQDRLDDAIREYVEALRLDAGDARAKRNLEIALDRKRKQEQAESPSPSPDGGENPPAPRVGQQDEGKDEGDALLRSVEQQEQEELRRMRRAKANRRPVGW